MVLTLISAAAPAFAESPTRTAREAYDHAVALHRQGHFAEAAREFATADKLVPNDSVLGDAIDATLSADDAAFGSMLIARAHRAGRGPGNNDLTRLLNKAEDRFRRRAGRMESQCSGACEVEVDGKALPADADGWLPVGVHVIVLTNAQHPGYRDEHRVEIVAARPATVAFVPPNAGGAPSSEEAPTKDEEAHKGATPVWFWLGAGVTVALAGGTALSWADASSKHSEFVEQGCAERGSDDCEQRADSGKSSLTRTNVLLGVTAASAVVTAAVGLFLVDWKPRERGLRPSVAAGPSEARAVLSGSF
jgi:hypothetical protein